MWFRNMFRTSLLTPPRKMEPSPFLLRRGFRMAAIFKSDADGRC